MGQLEKTIAALSSLLKEGDEADRCNAIQALGTLGDDSSTGQLIKHLHDEDIDVAVDAAAALGKIGSTDAVDALIETLQHDSSGEVRVAAVEALADIRDERAFAALIQIAENRPDELDNDSDWDYWWDIQLKAVEFLGELQVADAVPALIKILGTEANQDIETELLIALARIGGSGHEFLLQRLENAPPRDRRRIISALGKSRDRSIVKTIGRALNDSDSDVREHAIHALLEQHAYRYLGALLLLLRDPEANVRSAAAQAVPQLSQQAEDTEELVQSLLKLAGDPSANVRAATIHSLTRIAPDDQLQDVLLNALDDTTDEVVLAATEAINSSSQATLPRLLALSESRRQTAVRRQAIVALGKIGQPSPGLLQSLSKTLADKEQPIRLAALNALMLLSDGEIETENDNNPLQLVIDAMQGKVDVSEPKPMDVQAVSVEQLVNTLKESEETAEADNSSDELAAATLLAEAPQAEPELVLPKIPESPQIETSTRAPGSTLDAIAKDNAEAALLLDDYDPDQEPELDEDTAEYAGLLDQNVDQAEEMFPDRKHIDIARDVRHLAARMLANSTQSIAIEALTMALISDDMELRREAANSLATIADRQPGDPGLLNASGSLLSQLNLGDTYVRMASARALGNIRNRGATLQLLSALNDDSSDVRIHAIDALQRLAVEGRDPNPDEHQVSESIELAEQIPNLITCLTDESSGVRIHAANALACMLAGLSTDDLNQFEDEVIEKMIDSALADEGQQARTIAKPLRRIAAAAATDRLLPKLTELPSSYERRFVMEMLVELSTPLTQAA